MDTNITIWVPAGGTHPTIRRGAGIISTTPPADGRIVIDYEGNLYNASNIITYADRCYHAWGRQDANYPTIARRADHADRYTAIGTLNLTEGHIDLLDNPNIRTALAAWLDTDTIADSELHISGGRYEERRILKTMIASGDPTQQAQALHWAHQHHIDL